MRSYFPIEEEVNKEVYDLTQKQRRYEREIRKSKSAILALNELGNNEDVNNAIIRENVLLKKKQSRLRKLIKESNGILRRNSANERVIN